MTYLASRGIEADVLTQRALNQAARELLLAQSSDWAFMMKAGNYRDYAVRRIKGHLVRFHQLVRQILGQKVDPRFLADLEEKDNLFPEIPKNLFKTRENKGK